MSDCIAGRNPVLEALKSGAQIHRILVAGGAAKGSVNEITARARERGIAVQTVEKKYLDNLAGGVNHQGVAALVPAREYVEVDDILEVSRQKGEAPFILVLDGIEDPHNLGAIIRTADAAGVHGIIIPKRRAAGLTAAVAKASAGAVEYMPVARVTNLVQAVEKLKEHGCWVAAADMKGEVLWGNKGLSGPLACVIGGEGRGVSRLLREKCDFLVCIPMKGRVTSLNASVAAAILCYEVLRERETGAGR
ncbi:MAG: 23S rRNA (guanosine(2251)-2'-O)-methyltransferase RlmB [Firmicutes bacterium HGW-Firmicutes-14]|nr:MAG: 23S rRNA (guanosine(2251)-2'-O)-methyltransferase RlmB [Firmicutes bacterium HGW-Firmicutes-14]